MADTKISALPAVTAAVGAQELAVNDAGVSRKSTVTQLVTYLQTLGLPMVKKLTTTVSNSTTTGAKVTGLDLALAVGVHTFTYSLIIRSSAAATGLTFGVNFTGTQISFNVIEYYLGTGTAASTGIIQGDTVGAAEGLVEAFGSRTLSTTAPDLGPLTGVGTANVDNLVFIEGLINVSAAGNLELWHASETAAATSVEADSSLVVVRTG